MMTATDKPSLVLTWIRVAPQDYRATLLNGTEVRVSAEFVDDRDYDGGHAQWQWYAQINGDHAEDCTYETKSNAMAAIERWIARREA